MQNKVSGCGERHRVSDCGGAGCDILEVNRVSLGLGRVTGSRCPVSFQSGMGRVFVHGLGACPARRCISCRC